MTAITWTLAALAVVLAAGWVATANALARQLARERREHTRREDLVVNQILHLAGKPWHPAPADAPAAPRPERELRAPRFTASPEAFTGGYALEDLEPLEATDLRLLIATNGTES